MSIIDSGSVLVLGAGTSKPFGMPLGGELIKLIADRLEAEDDAVFGGGHFPPAQRLFDAANRGREFFETPIYAAAFADFIKAGEAPDESALRQRRTELRRLRSLLDDQTAETIDDFIVENPALAELAKIAVAAEMAVRTYSAPAQEDPIPCKLHPFSARSYPARAGQAALRNWIHLFINIVRHAVRTGEFEKRGGKIDVVTFNYDMILEFVLDMQFENTELTRGDWRDYINIIHVHGGFPRLQNDAVRLGLMCREWASGIHVVNEHSVPPALEAERNRARNAVRSAHRLYFSGFSFARPNCELLGLHELKDRRAGMPSTVKLSFCNYDGNAGVALAAKRWERSVIPRIYVEEHTLGPSRTLSVEDWIKAGYLGDLPG